MTFLSGSIQSTHLDTTVNSEKLPSHRAGKRLAFIVLLVILVLCLTSLVSAQCPAAKITEPSSNDLDRFGTAVFLEEHTCGVMELGTSQAGSIHVFERRGDHWDHRTEVQPLDGHSGQFFGSAVDYSTSTLLAGALNDGEHGSVAGAAYVFERDEMGTIGYPADDDWVQTGKLYPDDATVPHYVGTAVALVGDTLVIGARGFSDEGAAWVYVRHDQGTPERLDDTWIEQATLTPDGLSSFTDFGASLALSEDEQLVLVGDPLDTTVPIGAVTAFHRVDSGVPLDPTDDTWVRGSKLQLPVGAHPEAQLGESIALWEDTALLGAPGYGPDYTGDAYLFERDDGGTPSALDDTWTVVQHLPSPVPFGLAAFGLDVALSAEYAVISAPYFIMPPWIGSSVYVYERSGSSLVSAQRVQAPDQQVFDGFGNALALDDDFLLVGAQGREYVDDWAPCDGAAYEFDLARPSPWEQFGFFSGFPEPRMAGWSCLDPRDPVTVRLYDGYDFSTAILVAGATRIDQPIAGGVLVPSPDVLWFGLPTGEWGELQASGLWFESGPGGIPPGFEIYLQFWVQHPSYPAGRRPSNALKITQP